ncbi:MAG: TIGR02147 family protein [Bdellovibrionales bacterium]|jgi:uncharacterized protein (TIGR02147 family)|nr:TIGR02147 family protein [Bdellovibrionales bacterium]
MTKALKEKKERNQDDSDAAKDYEFKVSDIFSWRNYKEYLLAVIENNPAGSRGTRKKLAEAIGCQVSHITNVLSGAGHFSQEQAEAASRFLGLDHRETEFLLLLVQYTRAGTMSLREFYKKLLNERQKNNLPFKGGLKTHEGTPTVEENIYYSSWDFAAVHVLTSIPQYQTAEAIAKKLMISVSRVSEVLKFLIDSGLCRKEGQRVLIERPLLHLDRSSLLVSKHHINWRLRTIATLGEVAENDFHYSSVFSLSKHDYPKIKAILVQALSEATTAIRKSQEEDCAALCIDLFNI